MIRTIPIPQTVTGRLGCAPGGDCCDECRSHRTGPPIGPAATHVHAIPTNRNSALHSYLGETQCDQDGNCWTDGVLTAAPLTTGPGCPVGVPVCSTGAGGIDKSVLAYVGVGLGAVLLLELLFRRR